MRMTEQQGYIGMTGQREVAKNKPHLSLIIALKLIQPLESAPQGGHSESSNSSNVTARLRLRARAHSPCRLFP